MRNLFAMMSMLLAFAMPAAADPLPAADQADREIGALIDGLRNSPCRFQRNGRWYDGERAAAHLRRKYDYARDRGRTGSAEDFIERAASRSSFTGRPYRVQCGDDAAVDSGDWFRARLAALRAPAAAD